MEFTFDAPSDLPFLISEVGHLNFPVGSRHQSVVARSTFVIVCVCAHTSVLLLWQVANNILTVGDKYPFRNTNPDYNIDFMEKQKQLI